MHVIFPVNPSSTSLVAERWSKRGKCRCDALKRQSASASALGRRSTGHVLVRVDRFDLDTFFRDVPVGLAVA